MKTVYLFTDGVGKAHPVYQEASRYAPEGFSFTPRSDEFFKRSKIQAPAKKSLLAPYEPQLLGLGKVLGIPKVRRITVPEGVSLIHSGQYPLLNRTPWIMDFEHAATVSWYSPTALEKPWLKKFFETLFASESCKGLYGWTTAAKESMESAFDCSKFKEKLGVAHWTIVPQNWVERSRKSNTIHLLFCSGNFYYKGGLGAILAAVELMKQYDVKLTVVSQTPKEIVARFRDNPKIIFHERLTPTERQALMHDADILLHPGHTESYGFVMLEAFSYGLPVITTDGFSGGELVGNGERGVAIQNFASIFNERRQYKLRTKDDEQFFLHMLQNPPDEYIRRLAGATARLIESKEERLRLGKNAYESVESGMFSPRMRKQVMGEIYNKALV